MEQSASWEAIRFSGRHEIPLILWNQKVHYCFHKRPSTLPILSHIWPVHTLSSQFLKIQLNKSSYLRLGLPSSLFPSGFPTKTLCTRPVFPKRATYSAHPIVLDFMNGEYRWLSYSLCSFLHSPVTSSLLGPNILLNALFSNTLILCPSLNVSDQVSHSYKTTGNNFYTKIISYSPVE